VDARVRRFFFSVIQLRGPTSPSNTTAMLASASRRTSYGVVSFLLLLFFTALVIQYRDISRSSLESMPAGAETKTPEKPTESPSSNPQAGPGARPHVTSLGRISRLHYLVPTTLVKPPVCAVVASALVNRFPIPVLVGYKATGEFDAKAAHIAKLRAITRYLHGPAAGEDDDLVIVVDGFDVLAQIPAETLIQRYFDVAAAADQRLADQRGLTVEEVHSKGLRQTVLWGTDKGCFPSSGNGDEKQRDPRCWLVPFSTLPRYVWGPETGTGGLPFSDSRFVNSGTVIGPLGDLRTLIDATLALIEDTFDPEYKYHNSDQYYVSTLYARQEYQRTLDLNDGVFPGGRDDYTFPEPRRDGHDVTEYHAFLDTDYAITQTQCHNEKFMRRLRFANHDRTATVEKAAGVLDAGYTIQMPAPLYRGLRRLFDAGEHAVKAEEDAAAPFGFLHAKGGLQDADARTPISTTTAFTLSQLQALRALSTSLTNLMPDLAGRSDENGDDDRRKGWRRERVEYVEVATRKHLENVRGLELGENGEVRDGEWQGEGKKLAEGEVEGLENMAAALGGGSGEASSRKEDEMDES
ncbi:hypothetical protein BN1723_004412, partial [Verticillium longisporum]